MSKKKLLIHEVFKQGKKESGKDKKNGIALYLWAYFEEHLKFKISDKTLVRYYDAFFRDGKDVNIDTPVLNKLSEYLGFKNFDDFCKTETFTKTNEDSSFTSVKVSIDEPEKSLTEKLSQIVVNITTTPVFKLPEFLTKQSGMGILGVLLIGGIFVGKQFVTGEEKIPEASKSKKVVGIMDYSSLKNDSTVYYEADIEKEKIPATQIIRVVENAIQKPMERLEHYMYWNGERFVATAEADLGGQFEVFPMNEPQFKYFRKITCPDTITIKSLKKVWYSKKDNLVEFFTADGKNPENDKELHPLTAHILNKYILSKN
ncbi:hypothetical protein [Epilithonimonas sp.]|uniref:hypothetical protein n=1 Tax=Epilithonimonas sp. TaxID=2894511 RepID=UPI002896B0FA|nr:hypothetical protein [Epilithonimonas sp.]